jgi:hypothetical protein
METNSTIEWLRRPIRSFADTGGCNGWVRSVQGHESTELDAEMTGGKVASLMVGPFTGHEKPLLLVISRNSWASNLDYIHVITRHQHLPVENEPLLQKLLLTPREVCPFTHLAR